MTTKASPASVRYRPGRNPNSLKNLKPFPKGVNGNPNPVGYSISHRLRKLLLEVSNIIPPNANPNEPQYRDQIARTIVNRAALGDVPMVKELLDRTEGKVPEKHLVVGEIDVVFVIGRGYRDAPQLVEGKSD